MVIFIHKFDILNGLCIFTFLIKLNVSNSTKSQFLFSNIKAASNLDTICPFCGYNFNRTVRQVAEFSIGLFFACLFTFQLFPILVTIQLHFNICISSYNIKDMSINLSRIIDQLLVQLNLPIQVTIAPALVRAAVLILIHPQLQVENSDISNLRMTILQRVIQVCSHNFLENNF